MQRPRPEFSGGRHHLPDRIDPSGGRAEFEGAPQKRCAQVDLPNPGPQDLQCVDHREFVHELRVPNACDFVRRLDDLGRPNEGAGVDPVHAGQATKHRMGLIVDADAGSSAEVLAERAAELFHAVIEVREQRAVQMIIG